MKTSDFDYELPTGAIAQRPIEPRDAARLLVHHREKGTVEHRHVRDLPDVLARGDLLVVNDTRVRPARLCGARSSGGHVELLVVGPANRTGAWRALVKPAKRLKPGETFLLEDGAIVARALERTRNADGSPGQEWIVELGDPTGGERTLDQLLEESGRMPLPPYIHRERGDPAIDVDDRRSYQTVYARVTGAVAAPTAGLHFTPALLWALSAHGIERAAVTLHVGVGTFRPVTAEDVADHVMHSEEYVLPEETVLAIERARARGGRIVAVGTTSARVLESSADETGRLRAGAGSTSIFITPGHRFRAVDALMTNFHLPRSTLLMLVSAFAGRERVLGLYREALGAGYRFYSYGDAMLFL